MISRPFLLFNLGVALMTGLVFFTKLSEPKPKYPIVEINGKPGIVRHWPEQQR